jgi:phosphoserine aminotransferase
MKILISDAFDASLPDKLTAFGEVTDDKDRLPEVDVVLVRSKTKCRQDYIDQATNLRLIIRGGVGLDNIDVDYARSKGIQVFNTASASAVAVAELAFALMISVPTRMVEGHMGMQKKEWLKKQLKRTELMGKTLGLVGAGNIGTELARRAIAFGMRVIAYDPLLKNHECVDLVNMDQLLAESDYLSLHVPLTDETRGMINSDTMSRMKDGVVIINTARGGCVNEEDMVAQLKAGKVRAYATDVFLSDPPSDDCPAVRCPQRDHDAAPGRLVGGEHAPHRRRRGPHPRRLRAPHGLKENAMSRTWNFYAGPATLPLEALETARDEMIDWAGTGMSVMETSHRSPEYDAVHTEAMDLFKELLGLDDDHEVLFLQGGASTQFAMIPMNFIPKGGSADYVDTGTWSTKAIKEANIVASCRVAGSSEADGFTRIPRQDELDLDPKAAYVHITSNNTIKGTQYFDFPDTGDVPLVADMSSDILWRPFDANRFGLIYAGAQKNIGPSGVCLVIVKKSWVEAAQVDHVPTMLRYATHVAKQSLYNTPPSFSIYMVRNVLRWVKANGGLAGMEARNRAKANVLYGVFDELSDFYRCPVDPASRSVMNVVFRLPSEDLEKQFVDEAKAERMVGLKGHRSVGGCRASIYNAMAPEGVDVLAQFMREFAKKNG